MKTIDRDLSVYDDAELVMMENQLHNLIHEAQRDIRLIRMEIENRDERISSKHIAIRFNKEHADVCNDIREKSIPFIPVFNDVGELDHMLICNNRIHTLVGLYL